MQYTAEQLIEARKKFYYKIIQKEYPGISKKIKSHHNIYFNYYGDNSNYINNEQFFNIEALEKCWHRDDIIPQKYIVKTSKEVSAIISKWEKDTDLKQRVSYYNSIKNNFENGNIIELRNSHQRHVKEYKRVDWRDHLFYSWGVRHIHIANKNKTGGYIILVKIVGNTAYFINICKHKSSDNGVYPEFYDNTLWDIINNNWQNDIKAISPMSGVLQGNNLTNEERLNAYCNGYHVIVETNAGNLCEPDNYHKLKQDMYKLLEFYRNRYIHDHFPQRISNITTEYNLYGYDRVELFYYDRPSTQGGTQFLCVLYSEKEDKYFGCIEYYPSMYYMLDRISYILVEYFDNNIIAQLLAKRKSNQPFRNAFHSQ